MTGDNHKPGIIDEHGNFINGGTSRYRYTSPKKNYSFLIVPGIFILILMISGFAVISSLFNTTDLNFNNFENVDTIEINYDTFNDMNSVTLIIENVIGDIDYIQTDNLDTQIKIITEISRRIDSDVDYSIFDWQIIEDQDLNLQFIREGELNSLSNNLKFDHLIQIDTSR